MNARTELEILRVEKMHLEEKLSKKPVDWFFAYGWSKKLEQVEKRIKELMI